MRCILAICFALAACGGDDGFTPTLDQPWHPPGPDHQAECTDQCIPILSGTSHHGDFTIYTNPADDSPRAQWGRCFVQVMACWDPGVDLATCTAAADRCPAPCRDEYLHQGGDSADEQQSYDAFVHVFMDDDAPCREPAVSS
jgi:hypothetical protein